MIAKASHDVVCLFIASFFATYRPSLFLLDTATTVVHLKQRSGVDVGSHGTPCRGRNRAREAKDNKHSERRLRDMHKSLQYCSLTCAGSMETDPAASGKKAPRVGSACSRTATARSRHASAADVSNAKRSSNVVDSCLFEIRK